MFLLSPRSALNLKTLMYDALMSAVPVPWIHYFFAQCFSGQTFENQTFSVQAFSAQAFALQPFSVQHSSPASALSIPALPAPAAPLPAVLLPDAPLSVPVRFPQQLLFSVDFSVAFSLSYVAHENDFHVPYHDLFPHFCDLHHHAARSKVWTSAE